MPKSENPGRKAVVVGAGPGGLEAARILAERGHKVVVFEAGRDPGGQLLVAAKAHRRRDLIGIVDWRIGEIERLGVELRCGVYAEEDEILAEEPDLVVVATGGLPNPSLLKEGNDLVSDTWQVLTEHDAGGVGEVLVFDNAGGHPALDATERLAAAGAKVEYVTPTRTLAPEVGPLTSPGYLKAFAETDVKVTLSYILTKVRPDGNKRFIASLFSEYAGLTVERGVDRVVVENGTLPNDDLYYRLKPLSSNLGQIDEIAFMAAKPQTLVRNEGGRFQLFRIGDAVASRNVHAAIFDAARICLPA